MGVGARKGRRRGRHPSEKRQLTAVQELLATSGPPPRCRESNDRVELGTRLSRGENDVMHTVWMFTVFFFQLRFTCTGNREQCWGFAAKKSIKLLESVSPEVGLPAQDIARSRLGSIFQAKSKSDEPKAVKTKRK